MRKYIHNQTQERLSWQNLKKRLNASIPFLCPSVGEWELEPMPEPVVMESSESEVTLEERITDLEDMMLKERLNDIEDALIELAEIIAGE